MDAQHVSDTLEPCKCAASTEHAPDTTEPCERATAENAMQLREAFGDVDAPGEPVATNDAAVVDDTIRRRLALMTTCRDRVAAALRAPMDYPIVECVEPNYMGFCAMEVGPWVAVDEDRKVARITRVKWISLRMREEVDPLRLIPLACVIASLMHEIAHSMTESHLVRGVVPELSKKASRKWRHEDHGAAFYTNFARVMQVAEQEGLLHLRGKDKFSARSLKRFDLIDLGSPIMPDAMTSNVTLEGDLGPAQAPRTHLRVVVRYAQRGKSAEKPVVVSLAAGVTGDMLLDALVVAAKKALNAKGKLRLACLDGAHVADGLALQDDATLLLVKSK